MIAAAPVSVEERLRIDDLYAAYAACLDEGHYDEWPEFFTDDCVYRVVSRENYDRGFPLSTLAFESKGMLRDRVYGITQTLFHEPYYQRHFISHLRVARADGGGYAVRANYLVVRTKYDAPPELYSVGRCIDRLVDDAGTLRFQERVCIFDSELIANSMIYPL
jgi:salicylate 5-hydroxylase small subunit